MPALIHSARRRRVAVLGIVALCAAAIAGCGGDDDESTVAATTGPTGPTGPTGATGAAGQAQEVAVSETDFELDPADPTVEAGEVALTVTNDSDGTVHSLAVEGPTGEEELPKDLQPGDSGELAVELGEPGEYKWYCPIANHEQLGMVGDIIVEG